MKSNGPRQEPCGTPKSKFKLWDLEVFCDWSTFWTVRFSRPSLERIAWRAKRTSAWEATRSSWEYQEHFSWGGIVGWFLGGRVASCWCALKVCALGFLRHSHQTSLVISVYFSISARMIECNMIHRIAECHPLILFSICSQIELA